MSVELATLLDELARRHARGEPLDVEGPLAQAGDQSDELAPMIETFLVRAPVARLRGGACVRADARRPADPARPCREGAPRGRRRRRDRPACKIQPDARPKVRRYYQQLEGGVLDPAPVAASVWDAISALLGRSRESLTVPQLGVAPSASPMYRADRLFEPGDMPALPASSEPEPPDEVDALFLGESPEA